MNTLKVNTPEELHKAIGEFLQSDYSRENLVKMYDDTRKCAASFRGIYSALPVLSARKSDPLDGLQYIMDWSKEASKVVDDIASNLEQQTISEVTSQLKKLRGFADSVLSLVDTKLKEQAQKEARAKVEKEYKNLNEKELRLKADKLTLYRQIEVAGEIKLERLMILNRETEEIAQIYLSKDPTFKNRISQQDNEVNKVLEILNKLVGSGTPTGKLLDIYCKLKNIPLQRQFDDVGYAYSPIDDWDDVICGGCNRLYTSIDNVIKTFEEIQTKDLAKKPTETKQGKKPDVLLDSNILNLVRRRIKIKFAERRKALSEEVERIMGKLGFEGSARSSGAFKLVRAACDSEIGIKANIVWDSIQDVLDAVGLSITKTSASALKQEVDHHIETIVEEISKYMIQRLPMSKSDADYFDFENIKREVKEKFDVEVDLYVNSLTEKPSETGQGNKDAKNEGKGGFIDNTKPTIKKLLSKNFIKATIKHLPYCGSYLFDIIYGVDGMKEQKEKTDLRIIARDNINRTTPEPEKEKGRWELVKKISLMLGIIVSLIVIVGAYNKYIRKDKPAIERIKTPNLSGNSVDVNNVLFDTRPTANEIIAEIERLPAFEQKAAAENYKGRMFKWSLRFEYLVHEKDGMVHVACEASAVRGEVTFNINADAKENLKIKKTNKGEFLDVSGEIEYISLAGEPRIRLKDVRLEFFD